MMLVATPVDGSHYLIDVIAGVVIAALSLLAAHAIAAKRASLSQTGNKISQLVVGGKSFGN